MLRLLPSTMKWLNRPGREAGASGRCDHRPQGRLIHTYVQRCICFTIQMLLDTSLRESRKLNLYDVEIQKPTNQKWTVAPSRREEGRGSCVGCYRPVVSGLGCVLF